MRGTFGRLRCNSPTTVSNCVPAAWLPCPFGRVGPRVGPVAERFIVDTGLQVRRGQPGGWSLSFVRPKESNPRKGAPRTRCRAAEVREGRQRLRLQAIAGAPAAAPANGPAANESQPPPRFAGPSGYCCASSVPLPALLAKTGGCGTRPRKKHARTQTVLADPSSFRCAARRLSGGFSGHICANVHGATRPKCSAISDSISQPFEKAAQHAAFKIIDGVVQRRAGRRRDPRRIAHD